MRVDSRRKSVFVELLMSTMRGRFWLGFGLKSKGKSQAITPAFVFAVGDFLVFR
jgi:hypothetical protein